MNSDEVMIGWQEGQQQKQQQKSTLEMAATTLDTKAQGSKQISTSSADAAFTTIATKTTTTSPEETNTKAPLISKTTIQSKTDEKLTSNSSNKTIAITSSTITSTTTTSSNIRQNDTTINSSSNYNNINNNNNENTTNNNDSNKNSTADEKSGKNGGEKVEYKQRASTDSSPKSSCVAPTKSYGDKPAGSNTNDASSKLNNPPLTSNDRLRRIEVSIVTPSSSPDKHDQAPAIANEDNASQLKTNGNGRLPTSSSITPSPSPVSPASKPKATRTRKTPTASGKGANPTTNNVATSAASIKPETPKRATKASKAKQAAAAAAAAAATGTVGSNALGLVSSAPSITQPSLTTPSSTSTTVDVAKTTTTARKRKPRSVSNDSSNQAQLVTPAAPAAIASPPKRSRKKKTDQAKANDTNNNIATSNAPLVSTHQYLSPYGANPQLLSVAGGAGMPLPSNPAMTNASLSTQPPASHLPQTATTNRQMPGLNPLDIQHHTPQDPASRYFSLTISPYSNYDYTNAASLTRPSLSRLFTSSSSSSAGPDLVQPPIPNATTTTTGSLSNQNHHHQNHNQQHTISHMSHTQHSDEFSKAFEDLRDNTWSHLSKCILEQAQQFDIPSLIGTLYTLRSENEKLVNKVRDLTMKRDQLVGINARLDLPGPMLTQHLSHTSPNFSSVVAGLTNSPKSLPNSSPSPAMNKSPLVPGGSYANHIAPHGPPHPPGSSLGPTSFIDRSSPLVGIGTPHPAGGVSSLKSSTISTPSPPTGALLAHGANNRASLMTVNNSPYLSGLHPSINALNQLGPNPPSSSYYPRQ